VEVCENLANAGKLVLVAALDADFKRNVMNIFFFNISAFWTGNALSAYGRVGY